MIIRLFALGYHKLLDLCLEDLFKLMICFVAAFRTGIHIAGTRIYRLCNFKSEAFALFHESWTLS